MAVGGFGMPWGQQRTYSNRLSKNFDYGNGYNWIVDTWPYITEEDGGTLVFIRSTENAVWFDPDGGGYTGRYGAKQTLTHDIFNHRFEVTTPAGDLWEFNDFDQTSKPQGSFYRHTSPGGQQITVDSYSGGAVADVRRSFTSGGSTTTESFLFDYIFGGVNDSLLEYVTLRRGSGASPTTWTDIRRVKYTYYGSSEQNGSAGDLKTAVRQQLVNTTWTDRDTRYYRYWKAGQANGFAHGLKFVVDPEAYVRLSASYDPFTATDAQLAGFADFYYEYDSQQRVTEEIVDGGSRTTTFSFTNSNFADGYNTWQVKTVETRPDSSQNIVYTNYIGQPMINELKSGLDSWIQYRKYDSDGHQILHAHPSAVTSYNDSFANLNVSLRASDGLIEVTDYYTSTGGGAAEGYVQHEKIKQGSTGTEIKQQTFEYTSRSAGGVTVYPVSKQTVYRNNDGTGAIDTTYSYTWHSGTVQVNQRTMTLPAVSVDHNGSGTSATTIEEFDDEGYLVKATDERGTVTENTYDTTIGALTQTIEDSGAGRLNLTTDYENDSVGRPTQILGPSHTVDLNGTATTVRSAQWTVYKDLDDEVWSAQGYATGTAPNYTYTLVNPVSVRRNDSDGRPVDEISATRANTSGKLIASDSFPQSTWVRWTHNVYDDKGQLTATRVYHTIPPTGDGSPGTNYNVQSFGYDALDRQNMQKTPGGTITRTLFEPRGLPVAAYIGTNDSGATDSDPTGGGAPGNNMVVVSSDQYDNGNDGGDGYLTRQTQHVDSTATRISNYVYDFRGRRKSIDGEEDFYQEFTYNNRNDLTRLDRKDTTSSGNLIARQDYKYDDRNRQFRTIVYAVNPHTGSVGNSLTANSWYDAAGNLIKQQSAGSNAFTKTTYDAVGRTTAQYVGYDTDETSYNDSGNVDGDTILEQVESIYDAAGNRIQSTTFSRFHDATGTGELNGPTGPQPKARVKNMVSYPDAIGREQADANVGTYGGASFTRPATVPARSDTVLVNSLKYNDDGEAYEQVDPAGMVTRWEFDDAGREIKTIDNYIDGNPATGGSDEDRTTTITFTVDGLVATVTAVNGTTGDQITTYTYGTTLSDSDVAASTLLRRVAFADSANASDVVEYKYNRATQWTEAKDQLGSIHSYEYDGLGRLVQDRVTSLGAGTDGAVRRISTTYQVRGQVETLTSYDNATVGFGSVINQIKREYNDFEQLEKSYQAHLTNVNTSTTPKVEYSYADGSDNSLRLTKMVYPNGRTLRYEYNAGDDRNLNRISFLADDTSGSIGTHLAEYKYLGLEDVVEIDYAQCEIRYELDYGSGDDPYDGLDRFDRVIDSRWYDYDASADVTRAQYGFDRASMRLYLDNVVAATNSKDLDELYSYDGLEQLGDIERGRLNGAKTAIESGTLNFQQNWTFDATGNFVSFKQDDDGSGSWDLNQTRAHNKANEITDITETAGPSWITPAYDANGNMTTLPRPKVPTAGFAGHYDAWDRLVKLTDGAVVVAEYEYDGQNRRTVKHTHSNGELTETRHFYYSSNWQVIEERVSESTQSSSSSVSSSSSSSGSSSSSSISSSSSVSSSSSSSSSSTSNSSDSSGSSSNSSSSESSSSSALEMMAAEHTAVDVAMMLMGDASSSSSEESLLVERQFAWGVRHQDDLIVRDRDTFGDEVLNERFYALDDGNWNVSAIADTTGDVKERYVYDAYGQPSVLNADFTPRGDSSQYDWTTLYASYEYDRESGLFQVRFRYYHPGLGKWISRDPLGLEAGINLYKYVENAPVDAVDPEGLQGHGPVQNFPLGHKHQDHHWFPAWRKKGAPRRGQDRVNKICCTGRPQVDIDDFTSSLENSVSGTAHWWLTHHVQLLPGVAKGWNNQAQALYSVSGDCCQLLVGMFNLILVAFLDLIWRGYIKNYLSFDLHHWGRDPRTGPSTWPLFHQHIQTACKGRNPSRRSPLGKAFPSLINYYRYIQPVPSPYQIRPMTKQQQARSLQMWDYYESRGFPGETPYQRERRRFLEREKPGRFDWRPYRPRPRPIWRPQPVRAR